MRKRVIIFFIVLATIMTMTVPVMSIEETITVTFPKGEVTNLESNEMITVKFPEAINFNTIATTTVYAEVQVSAGTFLTAGDRYGVRIVANGDNSFMIDPSSLAAFATYKLIIDGVKNTDGEMFDKYISEEFTTGAISTIIYDETKIIRNVLKNKTVTLYNSNNEVVTTSNVKYWVDGDYTNTFNLSNKTSSWESYVSHYVVIDLGSTTRLDSMAIQSASSWYRDELGVYFKNDIEGLTLETLKSETPVKVVTSNSYDKMMHHVELDNEEAYRYIVLRNLDSDSDLNLREVFAFVQTGDDSATATVTFPTMVTNVETDEMITVEFSDDIDVDSITNNTVYALVQADVGSVYAAGEKHNVNVVDVTSKSFKLDVSQLSGFVEYKLVINGVKDIYGNEIKKYTSESFKTGAIAKIEYKESKIIRNVAKNKSITLYDADNEVVTTSDIKNWIDGDEDNSFNLSNKADGNKPYVDHYAVIDLGKPYKIDSVAIRSSFTWYKGHLGYYFKKSIDGLTLESLKAESYISDGSTVSYDGVLHHADVSADYDEYRYIVLRNTRSSSDLNIKEVYIFVQDENKTMSATVNLTSTPNAVTNIGTSELIEVTFPDDVDMSTVNSDTVYAICNTDRNPDKTGIKVGNKVGASIVNKGTNSFNVDVYNLDGLVDYTLVIDGVRGKDDIPVSKVEKKFKTGIIAKLPYQEGKIIKNVALNKTIMAPAATTVDDPVKKAGQMAAWIDGDIETSENFKHNEDGYVVIDLGNKYKIEMMGAVWAAANWTNKLTQIFLTNDLKSVPKMSVGFYWADRLQGCSDLVDYAGNLRTVFKNKDGYRYIVVKCSNTSTSGSVSIKELCAFAYEEANEMYIAKKVVFKKDAVSGKETSEVDKVILTAKVLKTDENTLLLAAYEDGRLVSVIPEVCEEGTSTIQVTLEEGNTYKAFLWDSFENMTPAVDSVEFIDDNWELNDGLPELEAGNLVTTFYSEEGTADGTSRGFAWTADAEHTDMVIRYALSDDVWDEESITENATYTEYNGRLHYKANIDNLVPGERYVYKIGDIQDDLWSEAYLFTTEPDDITEFSFLGVTDPQSNVWAGGFDYYKYTLDAAFASDPGIDFMVNLGDMVDTGSEYSQWEGYFNAVSGIAESIPHMAVVGNHETRGDENTAVKYYTLMFNNPQNGKDALGSLTAEDVSVDGKGVVNNFEGTVYSFDYGNTHFAVLNTGNDYSAASDSEKIITKQAKWLDNDLTNTDKKWKIVLLHQGMYPAKTERWNSRGPLLSVIDKHQVDLVLQGHDHMVARTYPMNNNLIVTTQNPASVTKSTGTIYSILGVAGPKRYNDISVIPDYMAFLENPPKTQPTYSLFTVNDEKISVITKQLDGTIVDSYEIVDGK